MTRPTVDVRGGPRTRPGRAVHPPDTSAGTAHLRGRRLIRSWAGVVTIAEFLGFAAPASVGALAVDARPAVAVPALLAAGAVEGAMLGTGQAMVLRAALPGLAGRRWIVATSAAAVVAYLIGLMPSTFADVWRPWPPVAAVAVGVPLAAALLASIGTAQWLLLRRQVERAGRWIATTAAAWLVGLAVFLGFAMPLWQPGQPVAEVLAIGVVGGLVMAATTSVITGWALARLLGGRAPEDGGAGR